jgi:lysophospholipase L1-like esterase
MFALRRLWPRRTLALVALAAAFAAPGASGRAQAEPACAPALAVNRSAATLPHTRTALRSGGPVMVLVIGSSTTAGVGAGGEGYAFRLGPELTSRGVPARTTVAGVSGETASGALARLPGEIDAAKPVLVVWQLGTNDAWMGATDDGFRDALKRGIALVRGRGLDLVLVDPQFYPSAGDRTDRMAAIIADVAAAEKLVVVRRYDVMKRLGARDPAALAAWLWWDRFHLSPLGHRCMAVQVAATIAAHLR